MKISDFYFSYSNLLDISGEGCKKLKQKNKKLKLELVFDLESDSVLSAWEDVSFLLSESLQKNIQGEKSSVPFKKYYVKNLDLSGHIDIDKVIENMNHEHKAVNHNHSSSLVELVH